jgi:hypothetical protein
MANTVNVRQSRGAGTVLMLVFFWWLLICWWQVLAVAWLMWLLIAGVVTIFKRGFFKRTWYQPWPAWMFGVRRPSGWPIWCRGFTRAPAPGRLTGKSKL